MGGGAEGAHTGADGEGEGEAGIVRAIRQAESWSGGEGGGEVEAELPRVAAGGEAGLERQPEHSDRNLGPHQRPVVVAELDRRLHGFRWLVVVNCGFGRSWRRDVAAAITTCWDGVAGEIGGGASGGVDGLEVGGSGAVE